MCQSRGNCFNNCQIDDSAKTAFKFHRNQTFINANPPILCLTFFGYERQCLETFYTTEKNNGYLIHTALLDYNLHDSDTLRDLTRVRLNACNITLTEFRRESGIYTMIDAQFISCEIRIYFRILQ